MDVMGLQLEVMSAKVCQLGAAEAEALKAHRRKDSRSDLCQVAPV